MGRLELSGAESRRIRLLIESAFRTPQLEQYVEEYLRSVHRQVLWREGQATVVGDLVAEANRQGLLDKLISGLAAERPDRPDLRAMTFYLSRKDGWSPPLDDNGLESVGYREA